MIGMVSVSAAQVRPGARPAAPAAAPAVAANTQGTPDQQIAACLHGGAHNEVELAKFAQERAKSDEVKDFAARMIKDHTQQADKLARIAGNLVNSGTARGTTETRREVRKVPATEGKEEERRDDRKEADTPREDRRVGREEAREDRREIREERREERVTARQPFNWVTVHKEVGEQCLESSKKELGRYEGADFDKAYMGHQIVAHMKMVDELKVFKNYATGQLQQDIEEGIDTAEHHLKEARKIMDDQKDKGSKGDSGRDRKNDDRNRDEK